MEHSLKELMEFGKQREIGGKTYIIVGTTPGGWIGVEMNSRIPANPVWFPNKGISEEKLTEMGFDLSPEPLKRKRGRPRKNPLPEMSAPASEPTPEPEAPAEA